MTCVNRMNPPWETTVPKAEFALGRIHLVAGAAPG
jgi:hypothetical protein